MTVDLSSLWSVLRIGGADAREFLHNQLTTDVKGLPEGAAQLSAYLSPKGRVIALPVLLPQPDHWLVLVHPTLAEALIRRLRLFVLRAKVTIDVAPDLSVGGAADPSCAELRGNPLPAGPGPSVGWPGGRRLVLDRAPPGADPDAAAAWLAADLALGIPHVTAAASDRHVAQMLGLERLGALSYRKGCYPGQEIVARAHYLGRVKRGLARFHIAEPLPAGAAVLDGAAAAGEVLIAAPLPDGSAECLAVVAEGAVGRALVDERGRPCRSLPLA